MSKFLDSYRKGHSEIGFFSFDLYELLKLVREQFPEQRDRRIGVWVQKQRSLASVWSEDDSATIVLHSVLNHPQTPEEVVTYILKHELLHLEVPPREVDGKLKSHPPEFFEAEDLVSPERRTSTFWLNSVLRYCLKVEKKHEYIRVKRNWKEYLDRDRPCFEKAAEMLRFWTERIEAPLL